MKTINNFLKSIAAIASIALISSGSLFAQKSGVFKTFADYQIGKMEYGIDCAKETHKIKLNDFWGKDYITVIHEGKPYNLKKAETWGFQLCDDKVVRFQGKGDYLVNDNGILWIYSKQQTKVEAGKSKTPKTVTSYYFSKGGNGEIKELTLLNIKAAYPENHMLHDNIDKQFTTDATLAEFDQFHKKYKINHFLESQDLK